GQQEQVQDMIVHQLRPLTQVAGNDGQRWRYDAAGHFQSHGSAGGVDATAHTAGTARDMDRIGWFAALQNDLIAAEERSLSAGLDCLAAVEIDDGVERQSPRYARYRINVKVT